MVGSGADGEGCGCRVGCVVDMPLDSYPGQGVPSLNKVGCFLFLEGEGFGGTGSLGFVIGVVMSCYTMSCKLRCYMQ